MAMALETGEVDEAVWDRQRAEWIDDLVSMSIDLAEAAKSAPTPTILLPGD